MKYMALLCSLVWLAGCATAPEPLNGFGQVRDRWQVTVDSAYADVDRSVEFGPRLTLLLRGSSAVDPDAAWRRLLASGATEAHCEAVTQFHGLTLTCRYHLPLKATEAATGYELLLPDDSVLEPMSRLPVEFAQGVQIQTEGAVTVPGAIVQLPSSQTVHEMSGGAAFRRYGLESLSTLSVVAEVTLPPGSTAAVLQTEPDVIRFAPRYLPRPSAWIALGVASLSAPLAIAFVFPISARHTESRPWLPDTNRTFFLWRWLIKLAVFVVNTTRQGWLALNRAALGGMLMSCGLVLLIVAWGIAGLYDHPDQLQALLAQLTTLAPHTNLLRGLLWSGWPVIVAAGGIGLLSIGSGVLRHWRPARVTAAGLGLALLGGLILLWPHLLLAPPLASLQLEAVFWLGEVELIVLALYVRALTHPMFRVAEEEGRS